MEDMENDTNFLNDYGLKTLSDGKLRTEDGHSFGIHKFVLAKGSKYFYAMFCGMGNKNNALVPGIKGDILKSILSYIYTGNISVQDENMPELLSAADYLLMDDLLAQIKLRLKSCLSPTICLSVFCEASKINSEDILKETYRYIQTHFESVVYDESEKIADLPVDALKQLLGDRNLRMSSEGTAFVAMIKWIKADSTNRLGCLPDLMKSLMIGDIDEELSTYIVEHEMVMKNPFCQEINDLKSSNPNSNNLQLLRRYLGNYADLADSCRLPTKLNCIIHYTTSNGRNCSQVYLTYDENVDLWRKILDTDFLPMYTVCVDEYICMFRTDGNANFAYGIPQKRWFPLNDFMFPRLNYIIVELCGKIYALGGYSRHTGEETYAVDAYDFEDNMWYSILPMMPVTCFSAIPHNERIYVIGNLFTSDTFDMVAQFFDSRSNVWSLLPPVSVKRTHFALVAYKERVYVIGGRNGDEYLTTVEVFDPVKWEWKIESEIPVAYNYPEATVLKDLLVVFDTHSQERVYCKTNPPVFWNVAKASWERVEESSPMYNLHFYKFSVLKNNQFSWPIFNENRSSRTEFEKSPFG